MAPDVEDTVSRSDYVKPLLYLLEFVDQLKELNTDQVKPLIHMSEEVNILREDEISETVGQQDALKNAPSKDSTYFKIPKVLDKKS